MAKNITSGNAEEGAQDTQVLLRYIVHDLININAFVHKVSEIGERTLYCRSRHVEYCLEFLVDCRVYRR